MCNCDEPNFSRFFFVSKLEVRHKSNKLKIFSAERENFIHLLNDFDVSRALIMAKGILYLFAFKIKFGQISESTKKIILSEKNRKTRKSQN